MITINVFLTIITKIFGLIFFLCRQDIWFLKFLFCLFLLLFLLSYLLYSSNLKKKLSYHRYKKYYFPKQYIITNDKQLFLTLFIVILYFFFIICGFIIIRYYNMNRIIDLQIYLKKVIFMYKNLSYSEIILNIIIIILIIAIYIIFFKKLSNIIKLHRIKLHLLLVSRQDYCKFYFTYNTYVLQNLIDKICTNLRKLTYNLGLKKYNYKDDLIIENLIIFYLFNFYKKMHYHILFFCIFYDIVYNNFTITYTYKVLPFVYIYELLIRLEKTLNYKNIEYDESINHMIYYPVKSVDGSFVTYGNNNFERTFEKDYIKKIIEEYICNNFLDRNALERNQKIRKNNFQSTDFFLIFDLVVFFVLLKIINIIIFIIVR